MGKTQLGTGDRHEFQSGWIITTGEINLSELQMRSNNTTETLHTVLNTAGIKYLYKTQNLQEAIQVHKIN